MGAKRCKICGAIIDFGGGYEVTTDGITKLYCSKEEYDKYMSNLSTTYQEQERVKQEEAALKKSIIDEICIIINEFELANSSNFNKELNAWKEIADEHIILQYLTARELDLVHSVDSIGSHAPQYNKMRYLSTIVLKEIGEFKSDWMAVERRKQDYVNTIANSKNAEGFVFHENNKCRKNRKKGFAELDSATEDLK